MSPIQTLFAEKMAHLKNHMSTQKSDSMRLYISIHSHIFKDNPAMSVSAIVIIQQRNDAGYKRLDNICKLTDIGFKHWLNVYKTKGAEVEKCTFNLILQPC